MQSSKFIEAAPVETPLQVYTGIAQSILYSVAQARATAASSQESRDFLKDKTLEDLIELFRTDEDPDIRAEVDQEIQRILIEEPEILYYRGSDRMTDYETMTDGKYSERETSEERNNQNGEYDAGRQIPYLCLTPEEIPEEDQRLYMIPYYRVGVPPDSTILGIPHWKMIRGKWQTAFYKSLYIDITFKTAKGFVTKPLAHYITYYFNLIQKEQQVLRNLAANKDWPKYFQMKDKDKAGIAKKKYKYLLSLHYSFAHEVSLGYDIKLRGKVSTPKNPLRAYREFTHEDSTFTLTALIVPIGDE